MTAILKRMTGEELLLMRLLHGRDFEVEIETELERRGSARISNAAVRNCACMPEPAVRDVASASEPATQGSADIAEAAAGGSVHISEAAARGGAWIDFMMTRAALARTAA